MAKAKTSVRQKLSSKSTHARKPERTIKYGKGIDSYDPTEALLNEDRIANAIWECLKEGDSEGVIEVIKIHLNAVNKTSSAKEASLSKTTLYHSFKSKNPTIKTLAKLVHLCLEGKPKKK